MAVERFDDINALLKEIVSKPTPGVPFPPPPSKLAAHQRPLSDFSSEAFDKSLANSGWVKTGEYDTYEEAKAAWLAANRQA